MKLFARELWTKRRRYVAGAIFVLALVGAFLFWPRVTEPITNYAECVATGNPILETDPPMCRAGNQTFTGPSSGVAVILPTASVPFSILVNGDLANATPKAAQAIDSQADWVAYWSRIHSQLKSVPPLLPVDFTKSTVLAINEGQEATNGYVYKITSITQEANTATIDITESIPTIGCTVAQQPSNRYYIVRAEKLHGTIVFRTNVDHRHCGTTGETTNTVQ